MGHAADCEGDLRARHELQVPLHGRRRGQSLTAAQLAFKACLNGGRSTAEHPAVPLTPDAIARDSRECQQAGCFAVHVHPRDSEGQETLVADTCEAVVRAVREACPGLLLGFSTRAAIEPDWERRLRLIRSWRVRPDFVSVNYWESHPLDLSRALGELGIGVEAGLSGPADAQSLLASGLQPQRVLVEISEPQP
ncbi:MAG: 3-keto-5-aminohexanoate cleavage protein [Candidatus Dormibacter sp.]|uniref:3-keto-5-aminohexanoate cleavage protein n=1 Tax=Candidatus Dormibacter sp. TaxID=2973982 RepID=UPI003D9ADC4B